MKNKYLEAVLIICGVLFVFLFGMAILPILVALLGTVAGVIVAFLPVVVLVVLIIVLAKVLQLRDRR